MGLVKPPAPAALFLAVLYAPAYSDQEIVQLTQERCGSLLLQSPAFAFTFSDYYRAEMGPDLRKVFLLFDCLIDPADLPEWKHRAISWEQQHCVAGKRRINFDPGYLDPAKLVLATTKNFAHRIYLGRGIYADVELYVRDGAFQTNPWTYPDYKHPQHLEFFGAARRKYFERLKAADGL
ncbi:MAG: DUF4416 family protein [candidate division KSB1 bacterium]|nr:DUF4416 family protein [candidate division KSB1 bacterium]MDZ7275493.1 DUF4416 family protein [candidate division KSB1 bacterium]MDZ7286195.1 DUF4416 family protein [candidate division KSB1 bacterium]MDZ7296421.1 DUF4416 family protein [candidate division KSB1 bacterium]MDZ7308951.1 DUF4416 family protein [candidate division KSB1 bacterium]